MSASSPELTINRYSGKAWCYEEALNDDLNLTMVQIPAGACTMGSSDHEDKRQAPEGPQHTITLPLFFMGKFAITQAQWRVVAQLPQVNRSLILEPSHFKSYIKGDHCPVEQVSWYEAIEFCARLSVHTHRTYTLPTEAQWEYACRGGTGTIAPFHFGKTITTDLANYRGNGWKPQDLPGFYGRGPNGEYRQKTVPVGQFPANDFGLYDMHGNVYEWCLDHWHENYQGAPDKGDAWLSNDEHKRVLRGASWFHFPWDCRSAARHGDLPSAKDNQYGFRVVCLPS